ncbi:MAG: hypothetical protein A4E65_03168 [Syntrophorhabdus sp. PtaU1.Bin153]|nr:MAG: hypothetical protein A4E65_03168 [Syntrophorhabdus sp. PtaU1.Bin153]
MNPQIGRDIGIHCLEETEIFLMAMSALTGSQDLSCSDIQCRKKGRGAMTNVVMRDTFDIPESHRQNWLRAI